MPVSAHIGAVDPFAESKSGRRIFVAVVVLLAAVAGLWYFGVFEKWMPGVLRKSSWVKNREAPAQPAADAGLGSTDSNIQGTAAKP
jgi:hypothetical protein